MDRHIANHLYAAGTGYLRGLYYAHPAPGIWRHLGGAAGKGLYQNDSDRFQQPGFLPEANNRRGIHHHRYDRAGPGNDAEKH